MFQITRKSIGSAIAAAALSTSLLVPVTFAAEPNVPGQSVGIQQQTIEVMGAGSYTAPLVLSHTADGWELDAGGPSVYFERIDE